MSEEKFENAAEPFSELADKIGHTPVATAHGIASIALSMAMKYHNINTVQDGALYQQYKLEGKNMVPLHMDHVFETAERIERWLLASSERIAKIVVDAIEGTVGEEEAKDAPPSAPERSRP